MILEMKVPSPGESITEVEIAAWLVADGDYVEKDQAIAEVDSDKATLELPAEASGIITLKAEEGDAVAVGEVVCLIDTSAERPAGNSEASKETKTDNKGGEDAADKKVEKETSKDQKETPSPAPKTYASGAASPAAKKVLAEKNMSASDVSGTGKDGRITKDDAVKAVPSMGTPTGGRRGESRSRLSMLRRKVAERLVSAKNESAMLTTFNEVDMSAIFKLREEYKEIFKNKHGVGLGFMSFFTMAAVKALKEYPAVNSMIDGQEQKD